VRGKVPQSPSLLRERFSQELDADSFGDNLKAWAIAEGHHYSLTLHDPRNKRIVGYDDALPVKPATWRDPVDQRHAFKRVTPYEYGDAAALLEAFGRMLSERASD
jgi:hypothetical protein